ncbi:hypothetical protein AB0N99_30955 [Streptomyces sp. NPDC093272]|uniref:hypothetical protein n=1 Tax=Streptomyces sp. NPDC093272 TaxID=3154981 RepID=UPI00343D71C8
MPDRQPLATPGSWVQIRDPQTLKSGDLRLVQRAMQRDGSSGEFALSVVDALAVVAVEAWSLQLPVPSQDTKVLDLMEISDYRQLDRLLVPVQDVLFPDEVEETPEQVADEASPTEPSAE